jgi:hypothetical protein
MTNMGCLEPIWQMYLNVLTAVVRSWRYCAASAEMSLYVVMGWNGTLLPLGSMGYIGMTDITNDSCKLY